jgi:hypothetical protein
MSPNEEAFVAAVTTWKDLDRDYEPVDERGNDIHFDFPRETEEKRRLRIVETTWATFLKKAPQRTTWSGAAWSSVVHCLEANHQSFIKVKWSLSDLLEMSFADDRPWPLGQLSRLPLAEVERTLLALWDLARPWRCIGVLKVLSFIDGDTIAVTHRSHRHHPLPAHWAVLIDEALASRDGALRQFAKAEQEREHESQRHRTALVTVETPGEFQGWSFRRSGNAWGLVGRRFADAPATFYVVFDRRDRMDETFLNEGTLEVASPQFERRSARVSFERPAHFGCGTCGDAPASRAG